MLCKSYCILWYFQYSLYVALYIVFHSSRVNITWYLFAYHVTVMWGYVIVLYDFCLWQSFDWYVCRVCDCHVKVMWPMSCTLLGRLGTSESRQVFKGLWVSSGSGYSCGRGGYRCRRSCGQRSREQVWNEVCWMGGAGPGLWKNLVLS